RSSLICRDAAPDSELDQFMEACHDMLVKYEEELSRPLQEAMAFLRSVESQLNSISVDGGSLPITSNVYRSVFSLVWLPEEKPRAEESSSDEVWWMLEQPPARALGEEEEELVGVALQMAVSLVSGVHRTRYEADRQLVHQPEKAALEAIAPSAAAASLYMDGHFDGDGLYRLGF
ncbi:unnamed protein product, partial [Musa acuminata var. zebrina]